MRQSLQQMVAMAIGEAQEREKLAQAEPAPEKKEEKPPWAEEGKKKEEEGKKDEEKEKTSERVGTELVEKVASAMEFIAGNIDSIDAGMHTIEMVGMTVRVSEKTSIEL